MKSTYIKKTENGWPVLIAPEEESARILNRFDDGAEVVLDIKKSRNPQFLRYAMKMFSILHDMTDEDAAFDAWRKWLTIQAGYVKTTGFADGSVLVEAESLSFESMDENRFQQCWKDMHRAFCKIYGNKITYDQLCHWSEMN